MLEKSELDLSIIIVSYNTKKLTVGCINSLVKTTEGISYEIIVVDNASEDESQSEIKKLAKRLPIILLKNKLNAGFGKANNQGLAIARGRYFLLLNSDTILDNNVLGKMVTFMDENPKVGVASCALKNADGSEQGTGGSFPTLFRVFAWMTFLEDVPYLDALIKPYHPMHRQSPFYKGGRQFKSARETDWVTGAFILGRREIISSVGVFDESYHMYVEEVDYLYRIKKAGWRILYLPQCSITHLAGASSTSEFPLLSEYEGIKLFYKKHMPAWQLPVVRGLLKFGAVLRIIIFGLLGRKELAAIYAKAVKIA